MVSQGCGRYGKLRKMAGENDLFFHLIRARRAG